jgi:hypothetical protein
MKILSLIAFLMLSLTAFAQPELPKVLTLEIDTAESLEKIYHMSRNAWFKLPTFLTAQTSSSAENSVKIYYNLLANNQYEFHCTYKSQAQSQKLNFVKCETMDGSEMVSTASELENIVFPMDKNSIVKMQLTYSKGLRSTISATFVFDWK